MRTVQAPRLWFGIALPLMLLSAAVPAQAQRVKSQPAAGLMWVAHPQAAEATTRIDVEVASFATTATGASSANEIALERVMRALVGSGISIREMRTRSSFLSPEYARPDPVPLATYRRDRRLVGYYAVGGVSVYTNDASRIGLLMDLAHGAGASRVEVVPVR